MTKQAAVPLKKTKQFEIRIAEKKNRNMIYKLRHDVYAFELGQHHENEQGMLSDALDSFNVYIAAFSNGEIAGFISITPPEQNQFSVDKYISRDQIPFALDHDVYEVRILTVAKPFRSTLMAALLMYAAFRWIEARGGTKIIAIGRRDVLDIYLKVGLERLGHEIVSGKVIFELLSGEVDEMRKRFDVNHHFTARLKRFVHWKLPVPFEKSAACYHGGAFFEAVGTEFDRLERSKEIINADVLDAWFPPSPKVLAVLREYLPWILRTSPPTDRRGMIRAIARFRGVAPTCILPGAGSSDLLFLTFHKWLTPSSKVLILDPTYGEYSHLLGKVIRCQVDRFYLSEEDNYKIDLERFRSVLNQGDYDLVALVNPNNPTGQYIPKNELEKVLRSAPQSTKFWVDEAYIDYVGKGESLELFASQSPNVIVCKSMSKVYALSGVRVAYLCASPMIIEELRALTPPWVVSLIGQIAAVKALEDPTYYSKCYEETHRLREDLMRELRTIGLKVFPAKANFVLCDLPETGFDAETVAQMCRRENLFIRNVKTMGNSIGNHKIRIAIKDEGTNKKMLRILADIIDGSKTITPGGQDENRIK